PNLRVNLKGTALGAPSITVNPLTVNFGNIEVGKSSQQTVSVSNTGTEALNITEITNPTTPFSKVGHNCPATLAIGDSCQINVKFSPTTAGSFSSSFNIKSNDPVKPTVKVTLNGVGIAIPDILVEPLVVIFPDTNVGFSSETNINVKNLGTGNLIINSVIPPTSSDFTISSNNCVGALVPNTTCQIKVKFSPTTAGQKQSSLTINSNDPDSPTVTVNLTGTGIIIPPDISVTPLSIDFGNVTVGQSSAPRTVTVSNIGGSNLMITSVVYPGTPFTILEDTCKGKNIAPNASCTIKIVFQPTRAITYYPYYLHINSNDPDTPQAKVTLQGTGVW
ncbi:MAG: choice-of-anchor D domain-containing protein, partial [Thermodesulfovibrionales bacterium]|nr:choice-of-anchor D domain-containing protein [Thermodesulfovibrionales bacterium]